MDKLLSPFKQGRLLNTLFLCNIFISFHYALVIYINSSYLLNYFNDTQVSALFIIGSIMDAIFLLNASRVLEKIGSYRFIFWAIIVEFLATVGLATLSSPLLVSLCFLIHLITISLILFNMDMFIQDIPQNRSITGSIRATYLTTTNITIVLAPSLIALLLFKNHYSYVYVAAVVFLIPMFFLVKLLKNIKTPKVLHINIKQTLSEYIKNRDLYNVFVTQFLLQFFYAYMVVYTPIYLAKYVGFSWYEIGFMFTIMLLPFVFIEVPVGELADLKYGEKEFLTVGFIIMGLSTIFMSFITVKVFWIWAAALFITRIGASLVEISSESYFFKHMGADKTDVISFFRISRPVSFIVAPIVATLSLQFIPFQYIFIVIGSIMVLGTHYSLALNDTK